MIGAIMADSSDILSLGALLIAGASFVQAQRSLGQGDRADLRVDFSGKPFQAELRVPFAGQLPGPGYDITLWISNLGPGSLKNLEVCVVSEGRGVANHPVLPVQSILGPREKFAVMPYFAPDPPATKWNAVVVGQDERGRVYAWPFDHRGRRKRILWPRRPRKMSVLNAYEAVYGKSDAQVVVGGFMSLMRTQPVPF
jgi:hypothetical protein